MGLTIQQVDRALPKVEEGLNKYLEIQNTYRHTDVTDDLDFQKKFNYFYRVRRRACWRRHFFQLLKDAKDQEYSFSEILDKLHKSTGRLEASFASKLLATVDPERAVLDSVVLRNMGMRLPYPYVKNRKAKIVSTYDDLDERLCELLKSAVGKYLIDRFKKEYPHANITPKKMLDLVLWQTR